MQNDSERNDELEEIVEGFLSFLYGQRNYSAHTVRAYETDVRTYFRYAKRLDFDALAPSTRNVRGYLSDQMSAGYSRKTINRRLSSLRTFFRWLNVSQISSCNTVSAVQGPKIAHHLPHVLSTAEIDALFAVLENDACFETGTEEAGVQLSVPTAPTNVKEALALRDEAIFEVLYATGARISEVAGLTVSSVNCDAARMRLMGKGSKERDVVLHDRCVSVLERYLAAARPLLAAKNSNALGDSAAFFLSKSGKPLSADSLRKIFKEHVLETGLDPSLSPHAMRHTFATDMLNGGADLRTVQELLGHASLSTTQIYTHLTSDRLKAAHAQAHPRA